MVYINTKLWQSALAEKSSRKKTRDAYINAPADCCNAELEPNIISCNTSPEQRFFVLLSLSNVVNRRFFYAILQTNIERCREGSTVSTNVSGSVGREVLRSAFFSLRNLSFIIVYLLFQHFFSFSDPGHFGVSVNHTRYAVVIDVNCTTSDTFHTNYTWKS